MHIEYVNGGDERWVSNELGAYVKVTYYTWWFAPVFGDMPGPPEHVEARDLDHAFVQAHKKWPHAKGWECLGRVDARKSDRATSVDCGIRETIVRKRVSQA